MKISYSETNAKAVIGDIVVTFTYDLGGTTCLHGDAQVIFTSKESGIFSEMISSFTT